MGVFKPTGPSPEETEVVASLLIACGLVAGIGAVGYWALGMPGLIIAALTAAGYFFT